MQVFSEVKYQFLEKDNLFLCIVVILRGMLHNRCAAVWMLGMNGIGAFNCYSSLPLMSAHRYRLSFTPQQIECFSTSFQQTQTFYYF